MSYEGYDSDGDVSRYLQSPAPESYLLDLPQPEVQPPVSQMPDQVPPSSVGFQGPAAIDAVEHQAPAMMPGFQGPAIHAGGNQATPIDNVEHHPGFAIGFPVPILGGEQEPDIVENQDAEHNQVTSMDDNQSPAMEEDVIRLRQEQESIMEVPPEAFDVNNNSWVDEMLAEAPRVILSPLHPRLEEQPPVDNEERFDCVPFVEGQLDCTRCQPVQEVTNQTDRLKVHFVVHCTDQGEIHHGIFHSMSKDANGQFQTVRFVYVDLHNHTHRAVQDFIQSCVDSVRQIFTGRLQDESSSTSTALPDNGLHVENEISSRLGSLFVENPENGSHE